MIVATEGPWVTAACFTGVLTNPAYATSPVTACGWRKRYILPETGINLPVLQAEHDEANQDALVPHMSLVVPSD